MEEKIKVRNLKAYSVFYSRESKEDIGVFEPHKATIIALNQEEAESIFKKFAIAKKFYDKIDCINIETQPKTKSNKHLINKDFYIRQNDFVNKLYEEFNKKGEKN